MKSHITFLLITCFVLNAVTAEAASKKKRKVRHKKPAIVQAQHVLSIDYPTIEIAYQAIQVKPDVRVKANAKPFGWQERIGPWYVANEGAHEEWAFTQPSHYAHPSAVKRMIDVGSNNHVKVDMVFRCGAKSALDCDTLFNEFIEVNMLIKKVYQKKYIQTDDGQAVWAGVDSLE